MGGGGGARELGVPTGGDWVVWAGQERARDHQRQEIIGGDEGFRAGKMESVQTDGEPMAREYEESK